MTGLLMAIETNNLDMVTALVAGGAKVDEANFYGWTPLILASRSGRADFVSMLLDAGADAHIPNNNGDTARMIAEKFAYIPCIDQCLAILRVADTQIAALFAAVLNPLKEAVYASRTADRPTLRKERALHFQSFHVPLSKVRTAEGFTPLGLAASSGGLGAIEALLDAGASVMVSGDREGNSLSTLASRAGHVEIADKLAYVATKEHARTDHTFRDTISGCIVGNPFGVGPDITRHIFGFLIPDGTR